jgi:hypothetical protein
MHFFLLKSTLILNYALLLRKLLVSEFLLGISETLHCSMSALKVKIVPLLHAHQLIMLSAGTLTYWEPEKFTLIILIICYDCCYYYYYIITSLSVFCLRFCINMYFLQCLPIIYL